MSKMSIFFEITRVFHLLCVYRQAGSSFFFYFIFLAALVFNAAHGLSLAAASRGYSFIAVCGPLNTVAPLVAEYGL